MSLVSALWRQSTVGEPLTTLEDLRREELRLVGRWFSPGDRVLEVGGGSGYQASLLSDIGCDICSIDLSDAPNRGRLFPVEAYDGGTLPFADKSFDRVFSSNVLEHVALISTMLREVHRVLRVGGLGIHILPTPSWRLANFIGHYPAGVRQLVRQLRRFPSDAAQWIPQSSGRPRASFLRRALVPGSHGGRYSCLAELELFSRRQWETTFRDNGFEVNEYVRTNLFYTGYYFSPRALASHRQQLAKVLGSSCHVFVTAPRSVT